MARNKDSRFGAADGFTFNDEYNKNTQEVQEDNTTNTRSTRSIDFTEKNNIGSTQGRKGHKLKRINMAFSDDNHEYIKTESRRQGISATEFVNKIIDNYRM